MTKSLTVMASCLVVMCASHSTAAELKDLLPCKPAAMRLCDRSEGVSPSALYKCATTLAARHLEIGRACAAILRQHGHLGPSPGSTAYGQTIPVSQ